MKPARPALTQFGLLVFVTAVTLAAPIAANDRVIIVQSTTSTKNSGLYDVLLPRFKAETGITARVVAVGTGQAIRNAKNCDGDVLLVHAKQAEVEFVASGFGVKRRDLMYNDFVIVGPKADPAKLKSSTDVSDALTRVARSQAIFVSRGDDSGTHKKERSLWAAAGINAAAQSGTWYRETGSGMGTTLNIAVGMGAYTLTDRATWIAFANKSDLEIVFEGAKALFNQYGVIAVNPDTCPSVNAAAADRFVAWIVGDAGQAAIASYRLGGQQLFFPNAQ